MNLKAYVCFNGGPFTYVTRNPNWNNDGVGQLNNGSEVTIIGEKAGWFEISFNSGSAWVPTERLYIETNNFIPVKGTITNNTTVQSAPCSNSNLTITSCTISQIFTIIAQSNGWYQVEYNNSTAWISCSDIKLLTY
ncbi:SH3 domain-containing protein [Clostridium thermobutyricum]|uniref:Bacterial SH3 domain protein n=1 Tax=Clostridium thermobutyricum DSM 4928 TaxID=1121339 RepID=A0A1V4SUS7_9CLOT|nr:SH3 domain-containing protein [Clostridium thermobutyricum]OPX47593.1 bacterial SH3 domain protein [Clostridium thermobutyricum DSM 4928]